jgi:hypothetical protein
VFFEILDKYDIKQKDIVIIFRDDKVIQKGMKTSAIPGITYFNLYNNYDDLALGMNLEEVNKILGTTGKEITATGGSVVYEWHLPFGNGKMFTMSGDGESKSCVAEGPECRITVIFTDGKVKNKSRYVYEH